MPNTVRPRAGHVLPPKPGSPGTAAGHVSQERSDIEKLYQLRLSSLASAFSREKLSFWLISFYLFLEYVRPQSIYPGLEIVPWALVAILLTTIFFLVEGNRLSVRNIQNTFLVLFLSVVLLSSAFAYAPRDSLSQLNVIFAWFIVYFLIVNIINTEVRFYLFLLLFILWNFKMTQHGFLSWAGRGFAYERWGVTGAPGWFHNSGEFGIQLCIFIPLAFYFIFSQRRYWGKVKFALVLIIPFTAVASVVATTSRGALLGTAAALFWMVLKSRRRLISLVLLVPIAFAVFKSIPEQSMQRFHTIGDDYTSYTRLARWNDAIEITNKHPVLGIGYANWTRYYQEQYPPKPGPEPWGLPHNIFFDASAELGYPGLVLFVLMIAFTFVNNHRTRRFAKQRENDYLYYTAHAFDAGMIGFLVSGSFVSVLYYPYFWIATALSVALYNVARSLPPARKAGTVQLEPPTTRRLLMPRLPGATPATNPRMNVP